MPSNVLIRVSMKKMQEMIQDMDFYQIKELTQRFIEEAVTLHYRKVIGKHLLCIVSGI